MVESILPKNVLMTDECKWLSRATLRLNGTETTGFAIHEVVKFP